MTLLLHTSQLLSDSELGASLLLDLINAHTRRSLNQSETALLPVHIKDSLRKTLAHGFPLIRY